MPFEAAPNPNGKIIISEEICDVFFISSHGYSENALIIFRG